MQPPLWTGLLDRGSLAEADCEAFFVMHAATKFCAQIFIAGKEQAVGKQHKENVQKKHEDREEKSMELLPACPFE